MPSKGLLNQLRDIGKTFRQRRGNAAEDLALAHLEARGLRLIERNYRCRQGEIDLILRDGATLVFAEVRYRAGDDFGGALASVTRVKQSKITLAALHYLQHHPATARLAARFDVIGVSGTLSGAAPRPRIEWIRDAFQHC
ncbi:MAG: YraN family protein [Chromatiales bacterium]|nr:YraN family protein [Chromatiales bacterium]